MLNYAVGDIYHLRITGDIKIYTGKIIEIRNDGPRLKIVGDAEEAWKNYTSKPGDYILKDKIEPDLI